MTGRILIIDDEETVRETFGEILSLVGFEVLFAANGIEGIEIFHSAQQRIDLILLDMKMPGMNGIETFAALRELDPQVKVILSSGYNESDILSVQDRHAITAFLQKPVQISRLLQVIKDALTTQ